MHQYSCLTIRCRNYSRMTRQRVCGAPGCHARINKFDSHDLCARCLPHTHFVIPRGSNSCPSCKHFNDSSYRSRIHKRRQAGIPLFSPYSEVSSHLDDAESVTSSEVSKGSHGGSRPHSRETSPDPPLDTSTHSGGYGLEEAPMVAHKRTEPGTSPASPRQGGS